MTRPLTFTLLAALFFAASLALVFLVQVDPVIR